MHNTAGAEYGRSAVLVFPWPGPEIPAHLSLHKVCQDSMTGREAFTGETTGQVLSCETGLIPRCRSHSVEEKATSSHGEWLAWEEPRAVGDLVHVETFFARNLGGLIHARP